MTVKDANGSFAVYSHPAIGGYAASWPIRNANLVKAMLIATRASAGARKTRSTRPLRTPFQHPIRFQSSNRRRAGAPLVPDRAQSSGML